MSSSGGGFGGLQRKATTGPSGFALQNGTPTILTYTVPSDGRMHVVAINTLLQVTVAETGGAFTYTFSPGISGAGALGNAGGGSAVGSYPPSIGFVYLLPPGTVITFSQTSALTAGAATLFVELWGS